MTKPDLPTSPPVGMTDQTFRTLNPVQRLALKRESLLLLIGQNLTILSKDAISRGLINNNLTYTQAFRTHLVSHIIAMFPYTNGTTEEQFAAVNWNRDVLTAISNNPQTFFSMATRLAVTVSVFGQDFGGALTSSEIRTYTRLNRAIDTLVGTLQIENERWDIYRTSVYRNPRGSAAARRDPAPEPNPSRVYSYAQYIPFHRVLPSPSPTQYEVTHGRPDSGLLATLRIRLQDQSANSALGNIIRGPTIRDGCSMLSLAELTSDDAGTVMDVTPLLRLLCMLSSFDPDLYAHDVTPHDFAVCTSFRLQGQKYVPPRIMPIRGIAMDLSTYVTWMSRSLHNEVVRSGNDIYYTPQGVDDS